jgi:RNA-dependent RNA polymerase
MRTPNQNWALEQELKVRVFGIPRTCWTAEVHKALSQYGTIVRIEMTDGTMDFGAFVTFQ